MEICSFLVLNPQPHFLISIHWYLNTEVPSSHFEMRLWRGVPDPVLFHYKNVKVWRWECEESRDSIARLLPSLTYQIFYERVWRLRMNALSAKREMHSKIKGSSVQERCGDPWRGTSPRTGVFVIWHDGFKGLSTVEVSLPMQMRTKKIDLADFSQTIEIYLHLAGIFALIRSNNLVDSLSRV